MILFFWCHTLLTFYLLPTLKDIQYMCIKEASVPIQVAMEVMDQVVLVNTQELEELVPNRLKQVIAVY